MEELVFELIGVPEDKFDAAKWKQFYVDIGLEDSFNNRIAEKNLLYDIDRQRAENKKDEHGKTKFFVLVPKGSVF